MSYLDYEDVPFMDQDVEFPAPDTIARVHAEVQATDVLWIFTAEYNYQIPGMLKNLLDWLSHPLVTNDWSSGSTAGGKLTTIADAGPQHRRGPWHSGGTIRTIFDSPAPRHGPKFNKTAGQRA